jgi:hypothetical protein
LYDKEQQQDWAQMSSCGTFHYGEHVGAAARMNTHRAAASFELNLSPIECC